MNPSHHNKYRLLILLIIFIVWSIGTILFWFVNLFAYLGLTFILIGDYFANIFSVIGIARPEIGWLLLGGLLGGFLGLLHGLKQTGRYSDLYKVYLIAAVLVLILQGVTYYRWESQFDLSGFQKVVLKEDFTVLNDWRLADSALIKDGGLLQNPTPDNSHRWSIWSGKTFLDIDFSAEVTKASGSDNIYFGLLARVNEDINSSFYYLQINGNGNYVMGKYAKERWEDRVQSKATDLLNLGNSKNRLRIVCKDDLIIGFINEKKIGFFRDSSYNPGKIAVYSGRGEENAVAVYFDNVLVKEKLD
ncbi:MAG: hypothetical protein AB1861_19110 [Cyanobacteriota bacterium]